MQYTPNRGLCGLCIHTIPPLTKVSWCAPTHTLTKCHLNNSAISGRSYSSAAVHMASWWMLGRKGERFYLEWSTVGADGGERERGETESVHYLFFSSERERFCQCVLECWAGLSSSLSVSHRRIEIFGQRHICRGISAEWFFTSTWGQQRRVCCFLHIVPLHKCNQIFMSKDVFKSAS